MPDSVRLPKKALDFYTKEILNDLNSGQNDWFTEKLSENQTFDWKPRSIFRIYFGASDKDVSPQDAIATYQHMKRLGGNVQLIELGNLNHIQSAYSGLPKTRVFFDSLTFIRQKQILLP